MQGQLASRRVEGCMFRDERVEAGWNHPHIPTIRDQRFQIRGLKLDNAQVASFPVVIYCTKTLHLSAACTAWSGI